MVFQMVNTTEYGITENDGNGKRETRLFDAGGFALAFCPEISRIFAAALFLLFD